jgi:hypothetical protein
MAIQDYSTYKPTEGVDWSKITDDIIGKLNAVESGRKANDVAVEKEKEALDLIMTNANDLMNKNELYTSQDFVGLMSSGANSGREQIAKWNAQLKAGELHPKDYKLRINNLQSKWATLANSAKTYDNANEVFMKRQIPDAKTGLSPGTGLEEYRSLIHAEIGDLAHKKIFFNEQTGEPYIGKIGKDGNVIDMVPTFTYAAPGNFFDNTIPIENMITEGAKNLASSIIETKTGTISDPRQQEATQKAIILLKQGVLSNNSARAQVLDKYGDYDYYRTEEEKAGKVESMLAVDIEAKKLSGKTYTEKEIVKLREDIGKRLILVQLNSRGIYEPIITEEQIKVSDEMVLDMINSQLVYNKSIPPAKAPRVVVPKEEKPKPPTDKTPEKAYNAWIARDWNRLATLIGGGVTIKFDKNGVGITKKGSKDGPVYYNTVYDLWDQFGYNSPSNRTDWDALMEEAATKNPLHIVK